VCAAVHSGGYGRRELVIRINALDTAWGEADLAAAIAVAPDAILLPKTGSAADVLAVTDRLARAEAAAKTRLWVMIETPLAILNLKEIAAAAARERARLDCLVLGTNDLVKETRADLSAGAGRPTTGCRLRSWRRGPSPRRARWSLQRLQGSGGFRRACLDGRALGFDGKTLVHPDQVSDANAIFAPVEAELAFARKILAAFQQPENEARASSTVEGRMVAAPRQDGRAHRRHRGGHSSAGHRPMTANKTTPQDQCRQLLRGLRLGKSTKNATATLPFCLFLLSHAHNIFLKI
jgi:citrate lyase subunit beta/citryl-CoA lyase